MFNLTGEYALRAMIYLAQHRDEWPVSGRRIAAESGIPAKYLSKILGDLVRGGVLESTRGKNGGFCMTQTPKETSLSAVLGPFERVGPNRCPFGNQKCSDEAPCLAHAKWKKVVEAKKRFLDRTKLSDVAVAAPPTRAKAQRKKKR